MDGLGRIIPKLLLSNAVQRLLFADVRDKFSMHVMTTRYIMMTWLKKTASCFGTLLPNNFHWSSTLLISKGLLVGCILPARLMGLY